MPDNITMRCPHCKRTMESPRELTDPPLTAIVETACDRCDDGGGFPEVHYYDADGRWYGPGETWVEVKSVHR